MGTGCFLDEWYEIVCINNNTVPTLKMLDLEVLNISLPQNLYASENTISVRFPVVYSNMSCTSHGSRRDPFDFTGSPFAFSEAYNIFVAVGCDNTAIMGSEDPSFVGCRTDCTGNNTRQYSTCTGYDCCHSAIPGGLQGYKVDFQNNDNSGDCQFAFLVNSSWFQPTTDLHALRSATNSNVPVVLQWGITNVSHLASLGLQVDANVEYRAFPYECDTISYINLNSTRLIQCSCDSGFRGNPFLPDGCEDINECEEPPEGRRCSHSCRNLPGYYECVRNRTHMFLAIGFSSGFGSLVLIFLSWWTYKVIKKRRETKLKEKFFEEVELTTKLEDHQGGGSCQRSFTEDYSLLEEISDIDSTSDVQPLAH